MLSICKRFEFCYGHQLPFHEGKCKNNHGHNAVMEIELKGDQVSFGPEQGMIVDFSNLKKIVTEEVIEKFDHSWINNIISNPTAENMIEWIVKRLIKVFPDSLYRVRLYETPDSYAEWKLDADI